MKYKKRIRVYLLMGLVLLAGLFCASCKADEEVLFLEADSSLETELSEKDSFKELSEQMTFEESTVDTKNATAGKEAEESSGIVIHVCGAVQIPGVYELNVNSRVMDAVVAAGGFTPEADTEYVNLATVLSDGNRVRIPTKQEVTQMSISEEVINDNGVTSEQSREKTDEKGFQMVNINTADMELLCTLPGIGQTRAKNILDYRTEHGPFSKIEDIMLVNGIKDSSFQKIKEYITIE